MTTYYTQKNGEIARSTTCEKIAKTWGTYQSTEQEIVRGYDGKLYLDGQQPTPPEPSYAEKRMAEYPSIGDQLDMIYWDKVNNTNVWQETIAAIKAKYPKV